MNYRSGKPCELCDHEAMGGGRWCHWHFKTVMRHKFPPTSRPRCGSRTGYEQHAQHAENPCGDCEAAYARSKARDRERDRNRDRGLRRAS